MKQITILLVRFGSDRC